MENQVEYQSQMDSQTKSTSDQTSPKSHGPTVETKICHKHGEYESRGIWYKFIEGRVFDACPKCIEERRAEEKKTEGEREGREKRRRIAEQIEKSGIPERFKAKGLETLQSKSVKQKTVFKAVRGYLDQLIKGTSASLIMCGKPGTGKSHIGCAMVFEVIQGDRKARYISTSHLMRKVKSTYRKDSDHTEDEVIEFYGDKLALLVIDEVGVQFGTETEKLIFYEIINRRYENMLPTVLVSNLTAEELCTFIGERAFDRFREDGGAILAFDWESYRK